MNRTAAIPVVLAALVALVAAPLAIAKLPPGTTFEACGASGCRAASDEESLQLQLKLIEPAMEHGTAVAPSGARAWLRVDLDGESVRGAGLRPLRRNFPLVFASEAGYIGVPVEEGPYRWVALRAKQSAAYGQLTAGVKPFAPQPLAELDPVSVARADSDAPGVTQVEGDDDGPAPTWLIISLAAAGLVVGVGLAGRARRVRHRRADPGDQRSSSSLSAATRSRQ